MTTTRLTEHFDLSEFSRSQYATRHGIDNTVPPELVWNVLQLCDKVLEPLRLEVHRPVIITSGYRCAELNDAINGASSSAHLEARAADIVVPGMTSAQVCRLIRELKLPYDQIINEFDAWCHVAVARNGIKPRGSVLTARRCDDGAVTYLNGIA